MTVQINFLPQISFVRNNFSLQTVSVPSFKHAEPDSFQLTDNKKIPLNVLSDVLNTNRPINDKINFSKSTLEAIENRLFHSDHTKNYAIHSVGYNARMLALRKFLIEGLPYSNSFFYTMHSYGMRKLIKGNILDNGLTANPTTSQEIINAQQGIQDNFLEFIGTLCLEESSASVNKFMKPHLKKAFFNNDPEKMGAMLNWYYNRNNSINDTYTFNIKMLGKNKYKASDYLNDKLLGSKTANSESGALKKLFDIRFKELNLNNKDIKLHKHTRLYNNYIGNSFACKSVETILQKTGFFKQNEKLDVIIDAEKIHYILNSFNLINNKHRNYRFDTLEYYGDAVLNLFNSRFLYEKNIPKEKFKYYYNMMGANKNIIKYTITLGLQKYAVFDTDNYKTLPPKRYADLFEAYIGALHLSFPEERVYNYLKPLFELMLNYIIEEEANRSYNQKPAAETDITDLPESDSSTTE